MLKKTVFLPVLVLALFAGTASRAQGIDPRNLEKLQIMEDSLLRTADSMFNAFLPDAHLTYSERFARQLVRTLKIPNSYLYPFDTLGKLVNIIEADDKAFRVFNWAIAPTPATKRYYGAIQMAGEQLKLYGLLDYTEQMGKGAEDSVLTKGKWFGALYYRIMSQQVQGRKVYFLFGYNAGSMVSNKKVLDPLIIDERGVTFGAPVFGVASNNFPKQRINRFILEYKKDVQVSMNWNQDRQAIIFDNLVSQMNDPNRKYTFIPSGQYDALRWDNGMWNYMRDVMPVTILKDGDAPDEAPKQ
ncbi:MAG: hypothetical protein V4649_06585 [Bacteroidota bacterium]